MCSGSRCCANWTNGWTAARRRRWRNGSSRPRCATASRWTWMPSSRYPSIWPHGRNNEAPKPHNRCRRHALGKQHLLRACVRGVFGVPGSFVDGAAGDPRHFRRDGTDQRQDLRVWLAELRPQSGAVLPAPGGTGTTRGRSGDGDGLRRAHSGMPHGGDSGGPGNAPLPGGTARSHALHQGACGRTEAEDRPLRPGWVLPAHCDRERERCGGVPAPGGGAGDGRGGHVDDRQQPEIGRESGAGSGVERGVRAARAYLGVGEAGPAAREGAPAGAGEVRALAGDVLGEFEGSAFNAETRSAMHRPRCRWNGMGNPTDLRFRSGVSFDGNRLTGLELSKRRVKIGLTTIYLEGRETLSASRMRCCCWSGMGNFVTTILSSTL